MSLIRRLLGFFKKQTLDYEKELLSFFPPQPSSLVKEEPHVNIEPYSFLWFDGELALLLSALDRRGPSPEATLIRQDIGKTLWQAKECLDEIQYARLLERHHVRPSQAIIYQGRLISDCEIALASVTAGGETWE